MSWMALHQFCENEYGKQPDDEDEWLDAQRDLLDLQEQQIAVKGKAEDWIERCLIHVSDVLDEFREDEDEC